MAPETGMSEGAQLYLDLLKRSVSNSIYDDDQDAMRGKFQTDPATSRLISTEPAKATADSKFYGGMWPTRAHTMIGIPRLDNLQYCVEEVLRSGILGDLIETGVWRGGASIFMRGILKAYGCGDRRVWVADSFQGLPPVDKEKYPDDAALALHRFQDLAVSLEEVQKNFARYGLLDAQVVFVKGWFRDSLPVAGIERLAVMRLDGDLYESTMDALENLYAKLSAGGFVIIDDYNAVKGCNDAVDEFRTRLNIRASLSLIPGCGAYWRKDS